MDEVTELEEQNLELERHLSNALARGHRIDNYMRFLRGFTKRLMDLPSTTEPEKKLLELNLKTAEEYLEGK